MHGSPKDSQLNHLPSAINQRSVDLIGVASSVGCPAGGSELGPKVLQEGNLAHTLKNHGIDVQWLTTLTTTMSDTSSLDQVEQLGKAIHPLIINCLKQKKFFTVIGGDHACAIGTWSGVYHARNADPFGLIWLDAHMDSHTPETSPSGALHGMPLACLLGQGPQSLTGLANPGPAIQPENLCLIGVRSYEQEEATYLTGLGVRIFFMEEVHQRGMDAVICDALEIVTTGTNGFGVSIDLDAMHPDVAPGVTVPAPNGLNREELNALLNAIHNQPEFLGLEIAEFNPQLDSGGKTAALISEILSVSIPTGGCYE